MDKCVVCNGTIPKSRKNKDTCSVNCGMKKMYAWVMYIREHSSEVTKEALKLYG